MKGLYYYKLVSPYEEDVTKNCKLTVNEIDSNFLNLKDVDIKSAELDEKTYSVVLTRNNGEKLVVDLSPILSGAVYDLEVVYENPSEPSSGCGSGASVYVTYDILTDGDKPEDKKHIVVPITGLVTTNNVNYVLGGGLLTHVTTDGTLVGKGTSKSPLGLSPTEKNRPAIRLIDKTLLDPEDLPENPARGDRYITKEYVSDYGFLYSYNAAQKIQKKLDQEGRGWRIPTKEDWDCMLSSVEPCDYCNDNTVLCHEDTVCHQILGKYAGMKLKSVCGWHPNYLPCECENTVPYPGQHCSGNTVDGEPDETDSIIDFEHDTPQPVEINECDGVDEYGMRILPTGYGDEFGKVSYDRKITRFWTSTHVCEDSSQDLYVKRFDWDVCGVRQEAVCPAERNSIRLVKDFDGDNYRETEMIDGDNYNALLFAECGLIWTASNFASSKAEYNPVESCDGRGKKSRKVYFINVWDGTEWVRRALTEGETVVIMEGNPDCQYNIEYRVYMEDDCNQLLVNTDDTVLMRVLDKVIPLIDEEREERISADTELWEALSAETEARIEADAEEARIREEVDNQLWEAILEEASARTEVDNQLWEAINQEAEAREETDQQLWEAIEQEASARTETDSQIWDALNKEIEDRLDVEAQIWSAITEEAEARQEVDNQLWNAINGEIERAQTVEGQLWDGINGETARAQEVEGQLWNGLNAEIERATERENEIDGQLIDVSKNPYILSVNGNGDANMIFESKDGNEEHFIKIKLNADFGTF